MSRHRPGHVRPSLAAQAAGLARAEDRSGDVRPSFAALAAVVAVALAGVACASTARSPSTRAASPSATAPGMAAAGPLAGALTVFAAASLTEAFTTAEAALARSHPGLDVRFAFAGSNALATQIRQGAPADVFAAADTASMQALVDAHLVDRPATFVRNQLEIAVRPGNPKRIAGLADLARPGVTVVLGAAGVPAGDYARQALAAAGVAGVPRSFEADVKSALAKVTSGEADAAIVYATDVAAAGSTVAGVGVPDADQPAIAYPIAVVTGTRNGAAAQAFVDSAVSGDVQKALDAAGFIPPP
ncbi:MAG: molybdate ABC transporter substrate-binding protein [Actinobacteria bacterium]|nr:molybdate ABC transporter substrate-binding protein [Actinomycetota bacterium]